MIFRSQTNPIREFFFVKIFQICCEGNRSLLRPKTAPGMQAVVMAANSTGAPEKFELPSGQQRLAVAEAKIASDHFCQHVLQVLFPWLGLV